MRDINSHNSSLIAMQWNEVIDGKQLCKQSSWAQHLESHLVPHGGPGVPPYCGHCNHIQGPSPGQGHPQGSVRSPNNCATITMSFAYDLAEPQALHLALCSPMRQKKWVRNASRGMWRAHTPSKTSVSSQYSQNEKRLLALPPRTQCVVLQSDTTHPRSSMYPPRHRSGPSWPLVLLWILMSLCLHGKPSPNICDTRGFYFPGPDTVVILSHFK